MLTVTTATSTLVGIVLPLVFCVACSDLEMGATVDAGCTADCVEVLSFEATPTSSSIEVQVELSLNAPCEVNYREAGAAEWIARSPSEDSASYGSEIPHQQIITGLTPGLYEVRARDHIGGAYLTETLNVEIAAAISSCSDGSTSWTLPPDIPYGAWTRAHWEGLFPGIPRRYGESDPRVQTLTVDGVMAQVHRMVPTPPGSNGSSRVSAAWNLPSRQRYRLTQSIRLPKTFAAGIEVQSGKLGWGLGGGTVPSGGAPDPAGFLVRVTFRGDGTQPDISATVSPMLYVYSADQAGIYGDEIPLMIDGMQVRFSRGEWMETSFEVVMNSRAGARDGELRAWIDGDLVLEVTDKMWFRTGDPSVDRLTLSSFHGGADSRWAPSTTNDVAFARVCLND